MTSATFVPGPAPTRLTRLRDLPRRGLVAGGGHVREICGQWGPGGELHWMLQLVELRRPEGVLHLPPDAAHTLAGIGGPQVGVGPGAAVGLRKERVLHYAGAFLELRRPQLRAAELSRVLVLSSVPARATPSLVFSDLHGAPALPADVRAIVVRSGRVSAGGSTATAMEALVVPDEGAGLGVVADDARVLMVVG
ncbi:hypothetical protein ACUOFU_15690 [Microbacterium arabinogalactanolyticum]|uniref:hypothetical protein n=1 Tax=Microbacterium arabinogalactanolyticum TaxID=69365 RepID=UPI004044E298